MIYHQYHQSPSSIFLTLRNKTTLINYSNEKKNNRTDKGLWWGPREREEQETRRGGENKVYVVAGQRKNCFCFSLPSIQCQIKKRKK